MIKKNFGFFIVFLMSTLVHNAGAQDFGDQCAIFKDSKLTETAPCRAIALANSSGSDDQQVTRYEWQSGGITLISSYAGSYIINGKYGEAVPLKPGFGFCLRNSATGNTFCVQNGKKPEASKIQVNAAVEERPLPSQAESETCRPPHGFRSAEHVVTAMLKRSGRLRGLAGRNAWCNSFGAHAWIEYHGQKCLYPETEAALRKKMIEHKCPVDGLSQSATKQ